MEQAIGTDEWLRMIGSLLLVLALAVGSLWGWRWLQNRGLSGARSQRGQLHVEELLQIGVRHKIMLVRAGSQQLLIGVSPNGLTSLGQWSRFGGELEQAQGGEHGA